MSTKITWISSNENDKNTDDKAEFDDALNSITMDDIINALKATASQIGWDDDDDDEPDCEDCWLKDECDGYNPDNGTNDNANDDDDDDDDDESDEQFNDINHPYHYTSHGIETIDKIEYVVAGLPSRAAVLLANVIKYVDRAGYKDDPYKDLAKANAYAHRLVYGCWPH